MSSYTLTNAARADLKSIAAFTQKRWGRDQRLRYAKQFDEAFELLAESPEVGPRCDAVKLGYRKFANGSHLIFYRAVSEVEIEIVRILHKRMDARSQFEAT
ncbi:MAG: type II toxin-antitoxin system RelE/ParE family toxin [Pseudomonadota bacterium]